MTQQIYAHKCMRQRCRTSFYCLPILLTASRIHTNIHKHTHINVVNVIINQLTVPRIHTHP